MLQIKTPLTRKTASSLKSADIVSISGIIYGARDAAHKKMIHLIEKGEPLPFDIKDQVIYYVGPCPERPGEIVGSAGPTTSGRMDLFTPKLIELGLTGMIGKGFRSDEVVSSMKTFGAVYFGAIGGAGSLLAQAIVRNEVIAFPELGPEALRRFTVVNFPAIVVIDSRGNDLYKTGKLEYMKNPCVCS